MNSVVNRADPNVREFPAIGPGERLRSARLARDMDLQQVAAELHLTTDIVNALEHDDYEGMPARVFVRGYLKNYARVVGQSEEAILQLFDEREPQPEQAPSLRRVKAAGVSIQPRISGGMLRTAFWLVLIACVGLVVLWTKGYLETAESPLAVTAPETGLPATDVAAPAELPPLGTVDLAPPGELALPTPADLPGPVNPPVPAPPADTDDAALPPPTAAVPVPAPPTADSATPLPSLGDRGEGLLPLPAPQGVTTPVAATPSPVPTVAPPAEPAAAPPGIVFEFSAECWVDIRDQDRRYKLIGKMSKGTRRTLGGQPPYDVVIGNVSAVRVTVDGEPFDVTRYARGKVARFRLDPGS